MFKRYRFVVALVLCLCVFAYDTVSISSDLGGRSFAWAGDPVFNGTALRLSSKLGLYFYLKDAVNGGKMTFTINNDATNKQELTFSGSATEDGSIISAGDNTWAFRCDTTSIQMADTIEATFTYNTNSEVKNNGENAINSVKAYLDKLVETDPYKTEGSYTNLKDLVNAIRDYGHYAQLALDGTSSEYGTHTPMEAASTINTTDITENTEVPAPKKSDNSNRTLKDYAINVSDNDKKSHVSYALDLDSNTALHVYLDETICPSGATVSAKVQKVTEPSSTPITRSAYQENGDEITLTQDNNLNTETISNTTYTVLSFSDIPAHEIDNIYTIEIKNSGETYTITISPLSYVYAVLQMTYPENDTDKQKSLKDNMGIDSKDELEELQQAVIAFYNYYAKTIAYRTSTEYSTAQ